MCDRFFCQEAFYSTLYQNASHLLFVIFGRDMFRVIKEKLLRAEELDNRSKKRKEKT